MLRWIRGSLCVLASGAGVVSPCALAHHSFAMFENRSISISGTVKKLEWTNPHLWLWVAVDDGSGGTKLWGLEGVAPGEATRAGWNKRCVVEGDKVTVGLRPLKSGQPGGSLGLITRPDGSQPCGLPRPAREGGPPGFGGAAGSPGPGAGDGVGQNAPSGPGPTN